MVLISPPEGWVFPEEPPQRPQDPPSRTRPPRFISRKPLPPARTAILRSVAGDRRLSAKPPARNRCGTAAGSTSCECESEVMCPALRPTGSAAPTVATRLAGPEPTGRLPPEAPPAVPPATAIPLAGFTPFELPEVVAGETFLSLLTRSLWGRVAVLAVSGLLGLAGVLAAVSMVVQSPPLPIRSRTTRTPKPTTTAPAPVDAALKPALPPAQFNRRWLPEQTLLLIDLRLSRLRTAAGTGRCSSRRCRRGVSWSLVATFEPGVIARS